MRIRRTKKIFFVLACSLSFFPMSHLALADSIDLGSFTQQSADVKFFKDLTLKVAGVSYALSADDIKKFIQEKESLVYNPSYKSEIENINFCGSLKTFACNLLFSSEQAIHVQKISSIYLDEDTLSQFLEDLARQTNKDPQDAQLQADSTGNVSAFSLSSDGIQLDHDKSFRILADYFKGTSSADTLELAFNVVKPEITTDSIDNLGITSLIGEGTSNFAGSPKNRVFNLSLGAKKFNGVLIKPGENFSFLQTLGPVDESTGYLSELVIKGDKTEPDFGGGMCQVSTTAFRAAIYSGLKITSRTPHAYPVAYYNPQGMDATVFIPSPDLKFTNNTPGYILIQTKIVGTQLIFDFYGTDDGRKTSIIGPTITDRQPDGSMKATFTQQVTDKNGNQLINDVFNSSYNSPYNYPHPGAAPLTVKPANWSNDQWKQYKKDNHS